MGRSISGTDEASIQFIPAQEGWLALFEETTLNGVEIHAEPVIAWCLAARPASESMGSVAFGQAVVGAGPWVEKGDPEEVTHFFALVREDQLDEDLREDLRRNARRSRESILAMAEQNRVLRGQGHTSWMRDRRTMLRTMRMQRRAEASAS